MQYHGYEPYRSATIAATTAGSLLMGLLWLVVWHARGLLLWLSGPLLLWWSLNLLAVAIWVSGSGIRPMRHRRLVTCGIAASVGFWHGSSAGALWPVLVLPVFVIGERIVHQWLYPPNERWPATVPLWIWVSLVSVGEAGGFGVAWLYRLFTS